MKILDKLTRQYLLKNKQRSIVTIIGIILSCALITATFSLIYTMQQSLVQASLMSGGNRHVTFTNVDGSDLEVFSNHKEIESYYTSGIQSLALVDGHADLAIIGVSSNGINDLEDDLSEGRLPTNENEILIDSQYQFSNNLYIGDKITLETGYNYYYEGENKIILDPNDTYVTDQQFELENTKQYTVVGVVGYGTNLSSQRPYNMYTISDDVSDIDSVHALYTNPRNFEEITNSIANHSEEQILEYNYNTEYFLWSGYVMSENTSNALFILGGGVVVVIMLTSIFCIRNAFAISVVEKTRLYGMLSSIGATPKQIRKTVYKEGFYLGIIGIPFGVLFGLLAGYILTFVMKSLLSITYTRSSYEIMFNFTPSLFAVLISVLLAILTIYFSLISSALKASKISEIEAIKNQKDIKVNKRVTKTPKFISKSFKTGGVIAYKNMKRNKKKFRTTMISIVVSIVTLISTSYILEAGFEMTTPYYSSGDFSVVVEYSSQNITYDKAVELQQEFIDHPAIEHYSFMNMSYALLDIKNHTDYAMETSGLLTVTFVSVGQKEYQRILDEYNLGDDTKHKGIFIDTAKNITNYEELEELFTPVDNKLYYTSLDENETQSSIELVYVDDLEIVGWHNIGSQNPYVLVSDEYRQTLNNSGDYELFIDTDESEMVIEHINTVAKSNNIATVVADMSDIAAIQQNIVLLFRIFIYGFITVISLIGLTNIFNTITTNMKLRAKEFAVFKSIGMSNKEFINLIRLESIFYGVKSLFWGLFISYGICYFVYANTEHIKTFNPPIISTVICVVSVFIIIYIIMRLSLSKINKQNIIETIKNENI